MSQYYNMYGNGVRLKEMSDKLNRLRRRRHENWKYIRERLGEIPIELHSHATCEEVEGLRVSFQRIWENSMTRAHGDKGGNK